MTTPNLQLPEVPDAIQGASDELREGFLILDALVQLQVIDRTHTVATLPTGAVQGDRYLIASGIRAGHIAYRAPTGWVYLVPRPGWLVWCVSDDTLLRYTGAEWTAQARNRHTVRATWVRSAVAIATPVNAIPFYFPEAKTIRSVALLTLGGPGSCVVDVRKGTLGGYPTSASICGANKPTISGGQVYLDNTLNGWSNTISAGDCLFMTLDSTSIFTYVGVQLELAEALQ